MTEPDKAQAAANSAAKAAAARLGLSTESGDPRLTRASLLASMGGRLGIVESILPGLLFVIIFASTREALASVIVAATASLGFIGYRLISRRAVSQALAGAIGVGIAAFLALREGGQAADYFLTGFWINTAYALALSISILVRWPLIGVLVGLLTGRGFTWRSDRYQVRVFNLVTLMWIGMFSARLAVQVPLYYANAVEALGAARIVMGLPLYAVIVWLSWLMLRGIILQRG